MPSAGSPTPPTVVDFAARANLTTALNRADDLLYFSEQLAREL
jgi:hypothetical protein